MNDLVGVVLSLLNEAIAASYDIKNFSGLDSPLYFGGGANLYWVGHGASYKLSARGHLVLMLPCLGWTGAFC
jgi:hypothetical protein